MRNILILCILLAGLNPLVSQQIKLHFPKFSGREWDLILLHGTAKDTVLRGSIPADGEVILEMPTAQIGYSGMARWMLRNGGGLDFVLNGESFSVECLSDQPGDHNIIYNGTDENTFLRSNHQRQSDLLSKYEVVSRAMLLYDSSTELGSLLLQEKEYLQKQYLKLVNETAASPLYAARFHEIVNFTRGIVGGLDLDEYARALEANRFVCSQLDWQALYTSNHWSGVIYSWVQLHSSVIKSDSLLLAGARQVLGRIESDLLYTDFCDQLVRYFVKFGKDSLLKELAIEVQTSGKLLRKDGYLAQLSAVQVGSLAPQLQSLSSEPFVITDSSRFTLVVFYQSSCGPCSEMLDKLVSNYSWLLNRGVRVISLSCDQLETEFLQKAKQLPWDLKYWERDGFKSESFQAYGVQGTPTLFLTDSKGVVVIRTADFNEIKVYLEDK